jgi:chitinase
MTTSTVYATTVYTITSCAATVTDCPARIGQVTTETVELYTTVCPVAAAETGGVTAGETGGVSGAAQSEYITTVVVTTYTDICPGGLTTIATSQTLTVHPGGPSPTIPVITTVKSLTVSGTLTTATLTVPFVATTPVSQTTGFKGNVGQFASSTSSSISQPTLSALSAATAKGLTTTGPGYPISTVSTALYPAGNATTLKAGSTGPTLVYVPASTPTHLGTSAGGKIVVSFGVVGLAALIVGVVGW